MIRKISLIFLIIMANIFVQVCFAWDNVGHRVVAYLAYQQLTPEARQQVDHLSQILDPGYSPVQRFLYLSLLPDHRKNENFKSFLDWHYVDKPYSKDGATTLPAKTPNLQTGLQQTKQWLADKNVSEQQKAIALSLLIHLVGDAHQPLHCIELYSKDFPQGDLGGNFFIIYHPLSKNLHVFWDRGLGLFVTEHRKKLSTKQLKSLANEISTHYAKSDKQPIDCNMSTWLQQCYTLAIKSYEIEPRTFPSESYIKQGQNVVKQQLVLAAQRLAAVLNGIYDGRDASYVIQTNYPYCRRG